MGSRVRRRGMVAVLCAGIILCGCSCGTVKDDVSTEDAATYVIVTVTRKDQQTDAADAREIALNTCGETLTITEGGEYFLHGSMEGQILIEADEDELVHLYLAGVDIASLKGPAVSAASASKLIVTLVSDTENILSDAPDYTGYEDMKGCLYSAADLTINGEGALAVYGYHEDGIRSKDRVKIVDGHIEVQAKGDGIRGNDGIAVKQGNVQIQSEGNGLRTVNHSVSPRGVVEISGGTINITAGRNGISAASDLYIHNCSCAVYSVEETLQAEGTKYIDEGCVE